jgi:transposase
MSRLNLTPWQRRRLRHQLAQSRDARLYRKTLAVLEFDHGRSAAEIARMLGVTRETVYARIRIYTQDHDPGSLEDQPGRGRDPSLDEDQEHLLETLLAESPQDHGYPHTTWTLPLLQRILAQRGIVRFISRVCFGSWYFIRVDAPKTGSAPFKSSDTDFPTRIFPPLETRDGDRLRGWDGPTDVSGWVNQGG